MKLVLLPGFDGTGKLLAKFAASFNPDIELITVSYPPTMPLGYSELESIARSFLPRDEPFFLLGESFSGPIAISIAATAPPGLRGLILCCSFARNPFPWLSFARRIAFAIPTNAIPIGVLSFLLLGRFSSPELRSEMEQVIAVVSPAVLQTRAHAVLSVDASALVSQIKLPILYLRASEDRLIPKASAELIASLALSTKIVEFEAPHFLLQVLPFVVTPMVTDFIRIN